MDDEVSEQPVNKSSSMATFRLLVPSNAAGSIIGKQGEYINGIKNKLGAGAYLRVPESPHALERLVLVTCELSDIPTVIKQLSRPVFKALKEESLIPDSHQNEMLLLISSQQAGRIIGSGGDKLKQIRIETGCSRFKVYKDRLPFSEERVVELGGDEEAIGLAVQQVMEIVLNNPLMYDHVNYAPSSEDIADARVECGGYKKYTHPAAQHNKSLEFNAYQQPFAAAGYTMGNMQNIAYDARLKLDNNRRIYDSKFSPPRNHMSMDVGYAEQNERTVRIGDSTVDRSRSNPGDATKDIYIDDCYTKHVIGAKGAVVDKIRRRSGASVQIAKDESVSNSERKISISGRQNQIDHALQLINEAIGDKLERDRRNGVAVPESFDYSPLFDKITSVAPFSDISDDDSTIVEKEIYITNSDTGVVIGPKGCNIKDIRQHTKCEIDVQNDKLVQDDIRRVALKGTARQIHRAVFMIQNIPAALGPRGAARG